MHLFLKHLRGPTVLTFLFYFIYQFLFEIDNIPRFQIQDEEKQMFHTKTVSSHKSHKASRRREIDSSCPLWKPLLLRVTETKFSAGAFTALGLWNPQSITTSSRGAKWVHHVVEVSRPLLNISLSLLLPRTTEGPLMLSSPFLSLLLLYNSMLLFKRLYFRPPKQKWSHQITVIIMYKTSYHAKYRRAPGARVGAWPCKTMLVTWSKRRVILKGVTLSVGYIWRTK